MKDLFARRGFRRLIIGQTISAFGDWIGTIGLMVLVLQRTHSSTAVGGVLVLRLLPAAVAGPLAARTVLHSDRKTTMLRMDAARAVMTVAVPFLPGVWWGGPDWFRDIWWIYFWAFTTEVASLIFLPARDASIPDLIDADKEGGGDLGIANGLVLGSSYGMIPLGAAAFGGLLALGDQLGLGPDKRFIVPFLFDALTYVGSYVAITGIPSLGSRVVHEEGGHVAPQSFHGALRIPLVRIVLPATAAVSLGVGALFSVGVDFVENVLDATPMQFGVLIAVFGVGAASGLAASRLLRESLLLQVRLGVAAQGAVIAAMSLSPTVWVAYGGALLFGFSATTTLVAGMSLLQDTLEGAERDLGFAAFHIVVRAGLAIAALAAGAAGDVIGTVRWPLLGHLAGARVVLFGAGLFVLLSSALVRTGRLQGKIDSERLDTRLHRHGVHER